MHVAPIEDSPKPPPERITLTFPVLNVLTRHVIVCGAGNSKSPICTKVFEKIASKQPKEKMTCYTATLTTPAPYPCSMVRPSTNDASVPNTLTWVVDADAMEGVPIDE